MIYYYYYKVGSELMVINGLRGPYKWPKINGLHWGYFTPTTMELFHLIYKNIFFFGAHLVVMVMIFSVVNFQKNPQLVAEIKNQPIWKMEHLQRVGRRPPKVSLRSVTSHVVSYKVQTPWRFSIAFWEVIPKKQPGRMSLEYPPREFTTSWAPSRSL